MPSRYPTWPAAARALADPVDDAVRAAGVHDADGFADALARLRRADPDVLATLLGTMTQQLIERRFPDGLDSDDAQQLLDAAAAPWFGRFDSDHLAIALIGALGMHDPAETPRAEPSLVTAHGLLLIAELLPSEKGLVALVTDALGEIHRAQTVEMP
ncbi:hypothetical protein [Jatrophihabitans fulvus]